VFALAPPGVLVGFDWSWFAARALDIRGGLATKEIGQVFPAAQDGVGRACDGGARSFSKDPR
jgi:hypothetical protein